MDRFRSDVYVAQVKAAIKLVGTMMTSDLVALNPDWGLLGSALINLNAAAFKTPGSADAQKQTLQAKHKAIFDLVRAGNYGTVPAELDALSAMASAQLVEASAKTVTDLAASAKSRVTAAQ